MAEAQSVLGDQLARVAVALIVFQRTDSPAATAATYALTILPAIAGGALLSGLADRLERRTVMVAADLLRAALLAVLAVAHLPIAVLFAVLATAVFIGPAFRAAQVAVLAQILDHEEFRLATGIRMTTIQMAQVVGFIFGGVLAAAIGSRLGLALDGASFAVSAIVIRSLVGRHEPVPGDHAGPPRRSAGSTVALIAHTRALRTLILLSWVVGCYVVPEGLAAPYVDRIGGGSASVGLLMAAIPMGSVVGAFVVLRILPSRSRSRALGPMAILAGTPLICCLATPPLLPTFVLWFLTGAFSAYQVDVASSFVRAVPEAHRGRASGLYSSGLAGSQGIGILGFGLVANATGVSVAIALAGLLGSLLAVPASWALRTTKASG